MLHLISIQKLQWEQILAAFWVCIALISCHMLDRDPPVMCLAPLILIAGQKPQWITSPWKEHRHYFLVESGRDEETSILYYLNFKVRRTWFFPDNRKINKIGSNSKIVGKMAAWGHILVICLPGAHIEGRGNVRSKYPVFLAAQTKMPMYSGVQ